MFVLTTNSTTFRTVSRCHPGTVERQRTTLGRKRVALRMTFARPSTVDNARGGSGSGGGSSGSDDDYIPDMGKRTLLNLILVGSVGLPNASVQRWAGSAWRCA
jgi:hypothetical protein